jgi:hypothetical protein
MSFGHDGEDAYGNEYVYDHQPARRLLARL